MRLHSTMICKQRRRGVALALILILGLLENTRADSSNPSLNEPFQGSFEHLPHVPCVTLYHRNGRIGCGTVDREVQTGKLQYYDGSTPRDEAYVIVLDEIDMTANTIDTIVSNNKNGNLKGILVLNSTQSDSSTLSPEAQAPQGQNTPSSALTGDSDYTWNGNGDGLMYYDLYGIPMAYVESGEVSAHVRSVSQDEDQQGSIVAEFNYYMGPDSSTSEACLNWRDASDDEWRPKCLPVGGTSIWAVAGSPEVANGRRVEDENGGGQRPLIMVATSIDATSMFHDASPGANTAASNTLALLMAAKLLGQSISDKTLDGLPSRISFGFFQAEAYGFVGSRAFFRDVAYPGFDCDETMTVAAVSKDAGGDQACLYPLRPSLEFKNLGTISGMLAVDQVGVLATDQVLYAHNDGEDGTVGTFLSQLLQTSKSDTFSVYASSVAADDDGVYPYPPTPLTSLLQLSGGQVGGAVLAGYDNTYINNALYQSHLDSNRTRPMNLNAVAAAATLLSRTALAAAYDAGDMDADEAAQYAANLIPDLSSEDQTLLELAECLYNDGLCSLLRSYSHVEAQNDYETTGISMGVGQTLGRRPSYYASVYDINNGQPFVQVDGSRYGSYIGDDYGKKDADTFAVRPTSLEMSIRGMLNDFLGRGSSSASSDGGSAIEESALTSCKKSSDCKDVSYCSQEGDKAVCTGGNVCVCSRAHYHIALDEALEAPPNNRTGYFVVRSDDEGISPMYTEPYWSSSVGVRVYRDAGDRAGNVALLSGMLVAASCVVAVVFLKRKLQKEKLY